MAQDINPFNINDTAINVLRRRQPYQEIPDSIPANNDWARLSFVLPVYDNNQEVPLDPIDLSNRDYSSARLKYTDSSIGGSNFINPPPQFNRYSDIRDPGFRNDTYKTTLGIANYNLGMGRYYSEAIDDNNQVIHLSFGHPEFNSLTQFFTGFYNVSAGRLARSGRMDDSIISEILYTSGQIVGLAIAPLFLIPYAILGMGYAARVAFGKSPSKFYNFKPAMHNYWLAAQGILNQIGVNMGVVYPESFGGDQSDTFGNPQKEVRNMFTQLLPDDFKSNGTINLFSVANKAKLAQIEFEKNLVRAVDKAADGEDGAMEKAIEDVLNNKSLLISGAKTRPVDQFSLERYLSNIFSNEDSKKQFKDNDSDIEKVSGELTVDDYKSKVQGRTFFDNWLAAEADAGRWASFRVDYTGTVSETFSNNVTSINTQGMFNSLSKGARDKRISFADGNIVPGMDQLVNGVKDFVSGIASTIHLDGLVAAAGSAFVDIPKIWEDSSVSLPKSTYTMTLISPYGNPISQMFNIYVPLSMLLAGALPLSTGKQSYTSPFICQLHDRGRMMIRTGIIDSLTITRGTSNLGFTNEGKCLAVEVSFSVLDLSSIMSVPIKSGFNSIIPDLGDMFDGENALNDYLVAISGMKLTDAVYFFPRLQRNYKRNLADLSTFFSAPGFGSWIANNTGVGFINSVLRGSSKT